MRTALIFVGLKLAEIVGVGLLIYGIILLSPSGEVIMLIVGISCGILALSCLFAWTTANWEWAKSLSGKRDD